MGAKRYLAIDLGERRTGLAGADSVLRTAQPLEVLQVPAGPALLDALARAVKEHGPDELVLGLPLNMDGTEGAAAARACVCAAACSANGAACASAGRASEQL
ncbi:MAG: Holliday junction resolvase RuvX [Phycisphaerales bacterium]